MVRDRRTLNATPFKFTETLSVRLRNRTRQQLGNGNMEIRSTVLAGTTDCDTSSAALAFPDFGGFCCDSSFRYIASRFQQDFRDLSIVLCSPNTLSSAQAKRACSSLVVRCIFRRLQQLRAQKTGMGERRPRRACDGASLNISSVRLGDNSRQGA